MNVVNKPKKGEGIERKERELARMEAISTVYLPLSQTSVNI